MLIIILCSITDFIIRTSGKSITVQIDSEDFIKIMNNLANLKKEKNPTVRSDMTIKPESYRNPYHPEDGVHEPEKDNVKAYKITKTSNNIHVDKKNEEVNAKIDEDNMEFLKSGNNISDDELTDNNTYNDLKIINKNSWKNLTLNEKVFTPNFSKRFIKKH